MAEEIRVGVIMGSDSDLGVMLEAVKVLKQLGIGWEINALSAHRTPHRVTEYVEGLESRGVQVVIAGAGGAAHLPGVIAALTPLPVVGVPIKSMALDGLDSLLSIVQMPPGIPVATVGVNAARNAGILAAQILGTGDPEVREAVRKFKGELAASVEKRNSTLADRVAKELSGG
jgi:5-(carboxyamino)imidazole ribonucleotide mutase